MVRDPYSKESTRENARDMAIETKLHERVDALMTDHAALLDWLDSHAMSLSDIRVVDPVTLRTMDADEALLWCALHEHRTRWIVLYLRNWLMRHPTLKYEVTQIVDGANDE